MAPTLDLDSIGEVLRQDVLADVDLAHLCLVSRAVYSLAVCALYRTIKVRWYGEAVDADLQPMRGLDRATIGKLGVAGAKAHLNLLVRRLEVTFEDIPGDKVAGWCRPSALHTGQFKACPGIDEVAVSRGDWDAELIEGILAGRPRLRRLENVKFSRETWKVLADQPDLAFLSYGRGHNDLDEPDEPRLTGHLLPMNLHHLVLDKSNGGLPLHIAEPVLLSSWHSLRVLELIFDPDTLDTFVPFVSLEVLHLNVTRIGMGVDGLPERSLSALLQPVVQALATIEHLPLRTLALSHNFAGMPFWPVLVHPLLPAVLPPTVTRLELSSFFTIKQLECYFGRESRATLTHFGHGREEDQSGPEVDQWLGARGIQGIAARHTFGLGAV